MSFRVSYAWVIDMKRFIAGMAAALLAAVSFFPCKVQAVSAQKAIVIDSLTGRVLYEKSADEQSLIASTTKIMTALVVCEQCNVLDRMRIPKEAEGIEGSSMYLQEGEVLTIQELLYGLMLHSGNDAAVALAIYCGGTLEGFVALMNDKAHQLGLKNTHFMNPHGLDAPGHYSSARDLATLTAYAMENPIFARTVSTKSVTIGERVLHNHNRLLWQVEGVEGVKTGYTKAAGRILVSSAMRQGRRLICVTIHDPNDWQDHRALLEDGFSRFHIRSIVQKGQVLAISEVEGGQIGHVELVAAEDFSFAMTDNEEAKVVMSGSEFIYAPIAKGQEAGYAYVCISDQIVGKIPLVFGQTVEQTIQKKTSVRDRWKGEGS